MGVYSLDDYITNTFGKYTPLRKQTHKSLYRHKIDAFKALRITKMLTNTLILRAE